MGCVLRPLGSPTSVQKRSYVHVPVTSNTEEHAVHGWVRAGCTTGVWYWVGTGGVLYRVPSHTARGEVPRQRSGPRKPLQGAGVGGLGSSDVPAAGTAPETTLRARSVPVAPPCLRTLRMPPPGQYGEISPHFLET